MHKVLLGVGVTCMPALPAIDEAQSLGAVAKRERERRQEQEAQKARVITSDDLATAHTTREAEGNDTTEETPQARRATALPPSAPSPSEPEHSSSEPKTNPADAIVLRLRIAEKRLEHARQQLELAEKFRDEGRTAAWSSKESRKRRDIFLDQQVVKFQEAVATAERDIEQAERQLREGNFMPGDIRDAEDKARIKVEELERELAARNARRRR